MACPDHSVQIQNCNIENVTSVKFLEVKFDLELTWQSHVAIITNEMSQAIAILYKAKNILSKKWLLCLNNDYLLPYANYCNTGAMLVTPT